MGITDDPVKCLRCKQKQAQDYGNESGVVRCCEECGAEIPIEVHREIHYHNDMIKNVLVGSA
jgi:translation initiation factor 2 beta subunit (eIF-2beta)/eIF-5